MDAYACNWDLASFERQNIIHFSFVLKNPFEYIIKDWILSLPVFHFGLHSCLCRSRPASVSLISLSCIITLSPDKKDLEKNELHSSMR